MMDYYWSSRDPQDGLLPWGTPALRYVFRTDSILVVARDLTCIANLCGNTEMADECRQRARELTDAVLALPHEPDQGKVIWQLVRVPPPGQEPDAQALATAKLATDRANRATQMPDFWLTGAIINIQTPKAVRPLIELADALQEPRYLDFAEAVMKRYTELELPAAGGDVEAGTAAAVIGLGVDLLERRPNQMVANYLQRLVQRCLEIYWYDGLITATPSLDYYEAASGSADLGWEVLRYATLATPESR
jgi:hypothetical protein